MAQEIDWRHQGRTASSYRRVGCPRSLQLKIILGRADVEGHEEILRRVGRLDQAQIVIRLDIWVGGMRAKAFGDRAIPAFRACRGDQRRNVIADDDMAGGSSLMGCASGCYPRHS